MLENIWDSGPVVMAVLVLLMIASVSSWGVIFFKFRELGAAEDETEDFLDAFRERPMDAIYDVAKDHPRSPLSVVFQAGYREVAQLERLGGSKGSLTSEQVEDVVKRLNWVQTDEGQRLERGLSFLATTGSASPFVGLFGTVVGIMNSFHEIGETGSASLATVAPGLTEALVATAVGLFAAIPAVIAYNYLSARTGRILERLDAFLVEYGVLLHRSRANHAA